MPVCQPVLHDQGLRGQIQNRRHEDSHLCAGEHDALDQKLHYFPNLLFDQILRSHVMVRVGGGWDTLQNYLDKHDPCRCRRGAAQSRFQILKPTLFSGHRSTIGATMSVRSNKSPMAVGVTYDRYGRKRSGRDPRGAPPSHPPPSVPSLAR